MNLFRKSAAVAVTALALTALPSGAQAHDGGHPFQNCPEAYKNGYANIPKDDKHYGSHLDADNDGVGCDKPPSGFVPAEDNAKDNTKDGGAKDDGTNDDGTQGGGTGGGSGDDNELAETGGNDTTPYLAGGGAAVLLAGGGLLIAARRRRASR